MADEQVNQSLQTIQEETAKVAKEIELFTRQKLMPIWNKRRDVVRKIPNFWGQVIGNAPTFGSLPTDNDIEAFENLVDFHVEFDDKRPNYRKIIATFQKNDTFKNETLTKEFTLSDEGDGEIISKAVIDYFPGKEPTNKKDSTDDNGSVSFLEWFASDETGPGALLSEDIFPNAIDYYQNDDEDDEDEDEEIELGSSDEDDEDEEEARPPKRSKK